MHFAESQVNGQWSLNELNELTIFGGRVHLMYMSSHNIYPSLVHFKCTWREIIFFFWQIARYFRRANISTLIIELRLGGLRTIIRTDWCPLNYYIYSFFLIHQWVVFIMQGHAGQNMEIYTILIWVKHQELGVWNLL